MMANVTATALVENLTNIHLDNWNRDDDIYASTHDSWQDILAFAGIVIFAVPSICGNVLVGMTILYSKDLRKEPTYMSMAVLAIMDLPHSFVALYPMGGAILLQRNVPSYETRFIPLNIIYPAWYCTCICYITIALNRWLTICHPQWNKKVFTRRNMFIWMSTWPFISVLCMTPILSGRCCALDFTPALWLLRYEVGREHEMNYQLVMCYVTSASATLVSCIVYPQAFWKIKSLKAQISTNSQLRSNIKNSDVKLVIQFALLTVVFTFTWIILHFEANLGPARAHGMLCYLGILGYAAMTGVNPLIYLTMNKVLRAEAGCMLKAVKRGVAKLTGQSITEINNRNDELVTNMNGSSTWVVPRRQFHHEHTLKSVTMSQPSKSFY